MGGHEILDSKIDLVVVSDAHLMDARDHSGKLFLEMLSVVRQREVEVLVLLGDIFDFCLGSHTYFHKKYAPFGRALEEVVANGTRVIYLEGNHEFSLPDMPWKGVEFIKAHTFHLEIGSGQTFQFGHGDLIHSDKKYRIFRKFIKSSPILRFVKLLPGRWIDWIANSAAQLSRSQDQYRSVDHNAILGSAFDWLERGQAKYGVFGHFHVPYAEKRRDGHEGGVFSVECWDNPNILVFTESQFHRVHLKEAQAWQLTKTQPVLEE